MLSTAWWQRLMRLWEGLMRLSTSVWLTRIVTGSFDKTAKIWSADGILVHTLKGFMSTVTGICYVPRDKTIWAAGGTSYAYLFDPKSGENVSIYLDALKVIYLRQ